MPKKIKAEDAPEAPEVEGEKKVAIEMTPAQAEEFAAYMRKKEDEDNQPEPEAEKTFRLNLIYRHNVNGKKYGPGMVEVPEHHLGLLQTHEERSKKREIGLNVSKSRLFKVMMSGQAVPVEVKPGQQLRMPGEK